VPSPFANCFASVLENPGDASILNYEVIRMAEITIAPERVSVSPMIDNPEIPSFFTGTFATQNTNNNNMIFPSTGKGRLLVSVDNPTDKACVLTMYGMFTPTGAVGDAGVFAIGDAGIPDSLTIAAGGKDYAVASDPFPWYMARVAFAIAPTDAVAKTVSIFVALMPY